MTWKKNNKNGNNIKNIKKKLNREMNNNKDELIKSKTVPSKPNEVF